MRDLLDGEVFEMKGSARKPYQLKNVGGVYSCSCPAWRNQSEPIERRTCKHLRKLRGDQAEKDRIGKALSRPKAEPKDAPPILLAHPWDNERDLAGWWMSEKLDGVRAYFDGEKFLSRQGNIYHAPDWFIEGIPGMVLDGELWIKRKAFQTTVSVVRRQDKSEHWRDVRFVVFDAPKEEGPFEQRMETLRELLDPDYSDFAYTVFLEQTLCEGVEHLQEELERVESLGGEGLMMRSPGSSYEVGRSDTLLKVKTFHDDEAVVIDHLPGKGRHKGRLGAVAVQLPNGIQFSVGTGFSDAEREAPPEIGAVITFRYQELSNGGVPRFPTFVRERSDHNIPKDTIDSILAQHAPKPKAKRARSASQTKPSTNSPTTTPASDTDDTGSQTSSSEGTRRFVYEDETSSKFWEVSLQGLDVIVRYGRTGTQGQTKSKSFPDAAKAQSHMDKNIDKKLAKGYSESTNG